MIKCMTDKDIFGDEASEKDGFYFVAPGLPNFQNWEHFARHYNLSDQWPIYPLEEYKKAFDERFPNGFDAREK